MFIVMGLNPAWDVFLHVPGPCLGRTNLAESCAVYPSGKGVNLARLLALLGEPALLLGFIGSSDMPRYADWLASVGASQDLIGLPGSTRLNVKVIAAGGEDTEFNSPGLPVGQAELQDLEARLDHYLPAADALVLTGSLPPGAPPDLYARWIERARQAGVPSALDASGQTLSLALQARPWLVKLNWAEMASQAGSGELDESHARALLAGWASAGSGRLAAGTRSDLVLLADARAASPGLWQALPPRVKVHKPQGAGDALMAGLLHAWRSGMAPAEMLRRATAAAVASVQSPQPGSFSMPIYLDLIGQVQVR